MLVMAELWGACHRNLWRGPKSKAVPPLTGLKESGYPCLLEPGQFNCASSGSSTSVPDIQLQDLVFALRDFGLAFI